MLSLNLSLVDVRSFDLSLSLSLSLIFAAMELLLPATVRTAKYSLTRTHSSSSSKYMYKEPYLWSREELDLTGLRNPSTAACYVSRGAAAPH